MTKIQMTAPRPRRIEGTSKIDRAIIAYFAARPDAEIGAAPAFGTRIRSEFIRGMGRICLRSRWASRHSSS